MSFVKHTISALFKLRYLGKGFRLQFPAPLVAAKNSLEITDLVLRGRVNILCNNKTTTHLMQCSVLCHKVQDYYFYSVRAYNQKYSLITKATQVIGMYIYNIGKYRFARSLFSIYCRFQSRKKCHGVHLYSDV